MPDFFDIITIIGIGLLVAGIAMIFVPGALMTAGVLLVAIGIYGPNAVRKR